MTANNSNRNKAIFLASELITTFPFIEKVGALYPTDQNDGRAVIVTIHVSFRRAFYSMGKWQDLVKKLSGKILGTDKNITYKFILNHNYN